MYFSSTKPILCALSQFLAHSLLPSPTLPYSLIWNSPHPPPPQQPWSRKPWAPHPAMQPDLSPILNFRSINHLGWGGGGGAHKTVLLCWSACLTSCPLQAPSAFLETGPRRGLGIYREPLWEELATEASEREGEEGALGVWMSRGELGSSEVQGGQR